MEEPPDEPRTGAERAAVDEDAERALRRALREFVRRHHPDRGGDPEYFIDGLQRLREQVAAAGPPRPRSADVPVTAYRRGGAHAQALRGLLRKWERRRNPRVR